MANDVFGIVGTTVAGAFRVEAVVAEGGFAVVYRAHHAGFRAPVALKCLKIPQYFEPHEQEKFEAQFQAEAELLFKLSASIPTIVRPLHVEAVSAPDGTFMPFLALEWLEGETLDALAQRRKAEKLPPFTLRELVELLSPVADALDRAHHFMGADGPVSIVHRDMKPENIFVAQVAGEQVIKILDFGIAKAESLTSRASVRPGQTDTGVASFTPAYGAPEQWMPKRFGPTGPWTDVWGLALTLVELVAGRPIVDGDQTTMMEIVLDPTRRPTPRAERISVGDRVEAVFQRALALDPRQRYDRVGEFWRALVDAMSVESAPRAPQRLVAASGGAGRHNLIPDLEAPVSRSSRRAAADPSVASRRPSAQSGQWPAPATVPASVTRSPSTKPPASTLPPSGAPTLRPSSPPSAPIEPPAVSSGLLLEPVEPRLSRPPLSSARPPAGDQRVAPLPPVRFGAVDRLEAYRPFLAPLFMVLGGVLITVLEGAYAASEGQVLTLGPLSPGWVAAGLVIGGIGLGLYRLVAPDL